MPDHSFRSLAKRRDFDLVFEKGAVAAAKHIVLYARPNNLSFHRLGLAVSKKLGTAVVRNRVKRLLREAIRQVLGDTLRRYDFVIVARKGAAEATLRQFVSELEHSLSRITNEKNPDRDYRNV